jgi:hypothetical protein
VDVDDGVVVYRNASWSPTRALLDPAGAEAARTTDLAGAAAADLTGSTPALIDHPRPTQAEGDVPAGELYVATPASGRWRLTVDGDEVGGRTAFGWANAWTVPEAGHAELTYRTPPTRWLLLAGQALLWLAALQQVVRAAALGEEPAARRRASRRHAASGEAPPAAGVPEVAVPVGAEEAPLVVVGGGGGWASAREGHAGRDLHEGRPRDAHGSSPVVDREAPTWDDDEPVWGDEEPSRAGEEEERPFGPSFAEAWATHEDGDDVAAAEAPPGEPAVIDEEPPAVEGAAAEPAAVADEPTDASEPELRWGDDEEPRA